jgi:hypothetical protein
VLELLRNDAELLAIADAVAATQTGAAGAGAGDAAAGERAAPDERKMEPRSDRI